ncbi:hypothetical protein HNR21_000600 [Actinomadura cellulosilytica]|uniref:Uncharacterized protein n=1 Tax=Thermomonospora cellulosilytica TaxID=1411118 RepID=A0A7W3MTP6_9ACTN|nr:hypothetical protein [Thermomonospora cellulosilytica]MBA9001718.1 hypothetical protein [Thermomonospora cellulosilytica]
MISSAPCPAAHRAASRSSFGVPELRLTSTFPLSAASEPANVSYMAA